MLPKDSDLDSKVYLTSSTKWLLCQLAVLGIVNIYILCVLRKRSIKLAGIEQAIKAEGGMKISPGVKGKNASSTQTINIASIHRMLLQRYNESIISFLLGSFFGITVTQIIMDVLIFVVIQGQTDKFTLLGKNHNKMGFFLSSLGLYHFAEYMYKCRYQFFGNDKKLNWNDFQLNHSWAYNLAIFLCFCEYGARWYIISAWYPKFHYDVNALGKFVNFVYTIDNSQISKIISIIGGTMVLIGHYFRIGSMFYAGTNFNHLV